MPKKGIFDRLKEAVLEDDGTSKSPEAEIPAAHPAPSIGFGLGTIGSPAPAPSAAPSLSPNEPLDPAAVQAVEQGVYVDFGGKPSRLLKFVQMWHKLGQSKDVSTVIGALQVFDNTITAQNILEDLDGHFKLLDNTSSQAKATFEDAAREKVGGAEDEIARLEREAKEVSAQIDQLQQENHARGVRVSELATQRDVARGKIEIAFKKTEAATAKVRADLTTLQQLLSSAR